MPYLTLRAPITGALLAAALVAAAVVSTGPAGTGASRDETGVRPAVDVASVPVASRKPTCRLGKAARGPKQVIVVRATGSSATVRACKRTKSGRYVVVRGPFKGHVGRSGVARPGAKREGDGRTPGGVFPMRGGFGGASDPGVRVGWDRVDGRDVWVDDPTSALYNRAARKPARGRWSSAENLRIPAYTYAQVIGYNESRTPYRGSAIFLHLDDGAGTAGCVSLKRKALLKVLRWQKPGATMSIRKA